MLLLASSLSPGVLLLLLLLFLLFALLLLPTPGLFLALFRLLLSGFGLLLESCQLVDALKPVRIAGGSIRLRPDLHPCLVEAQPDRLLRGLLLSPLALDFLHDFLHFLLSQVLIVLHLDVAECSLHPLHVPLNGLLLLRAQVGVIVPLLGLQVPVSLPPLAALVQHSDHCRVAQVHLAVPIGHLADRLPLEEAPAASVAGPNGHVELPVFLLL